MESHAHQGLIFTIKPLSFSFPYTIHLPHNMPHTTSSRSKHRHTPYSIRVLAASPLTPPPQRPIDITPHSNGGERRSPLCFYNTWASYQGVCPCKGCTQSEHFMPKFEGMKCRLGALWYPTSPGATEFSWTVTRIGDNDWEESEFEFVGGEEEETKEKEAGEEEEGEEEKQKFVLMVVEGVEQRDFWKVWG
ncbi:hypothetical protein BDD12DRAFT_924980 [Trichophaea hybrida]|nr:hypothetical protein BDD12DRAFT_924980 [Trichophaea hybrida]